jgi:hypothetical protein
MWEACAGTVWARVMGPRLPFAGDEVAAGEAVATAD